MNIANILILAQAASPASTGTNSGAGGLGGIIVPMACMAVIFYFLVIRPQGQKQKQAAALISALKTGDKVVTAGGIHGLIANVKETTVIVKVADNVKIEVDKAGIITVTKRSEVETSPAS